MYCFTGKQWINLAQIRTISVDGERVTVCWADGKYQGFNDVESKEILKTLKEYTTK